MPRSIPVKQSAMKSGKGYIPARGDVVWLDFNPQMGHEQRGRRPALILSPSAYHAKTSLCICLPITTKIKGYPFEVRLPENLPVKGVILADQVKSLDFVQRRAEKIMKLEDSLLKQVQRKLLLLID